METDDSKSRRSKRVAAAAAQQQSSSGGPRDSNVTSSNTNLNTGQSGMEGEGKNKKDMRGKKRKTTTVDFARLDMLSLLRYQRHFDLPVRLAAPKIELIYHVRKHFLHHPKLKDGEVIAQFLHQNRKQHREIQQTKE